MNFIEEMKKKARTDIKTIVLPEAEDKRVLEAASKVEKEAFAKIILIGNIEKTKELAKENNIDITNIEIIDPEKSEKYAEYVQAFYELRKAKGITEEDAKKIIKNPVYFGMMMVKREDADGLVSGAAHSTSDTLRPALQILKTAPGTKLVSAFFLMNVPNCKYGENGIFVFADSGLNENPDSDKLAEIAASSAKSFEQLVGKEAKVGMLSYSTYGSAKSELTEKVIEATKLLKERYPNIKSDGELQLDAAIIPEVAALKAPGSKVAGQANVLIFPNLEAGNIGYKMAQRFGNALAIGPVTQGLKKPVNDLSRGSSVEDIVGTIIVTCMQVK